MSLCLHGWVDEDGCAESCDGPQEIAGYCEMHAEFHGEEMVEEIARLRAELEEAVGALDAATELLSLPEHGWEPEDYEKHGRVNDVYRRLAARAEGREDRRGERGEGQ